MKRLNFSQINALNYHILDSPKCKETYYSKNLYLKVRGPISQMSMGTTRMILDRLDRRGV